MDFSKFDCGNTDFNDFIRTDALKDFIEDYSVTYVGMVSGKPAAFVSLIAAAYQTKNIYEKGSEEFQYQQIPAIKIARIATDRTCQNKGCGEYLIDHSAAIALKIKKYVGCKLMVTDALPEKIKWYEKRGFKLSIDRKRTEAGRENYPMHAFLPPVKK